MTLAALCNAHGINMEAAAEREVARITHPDMIVKIRAKQASKPTGSALPGRYPDDPINLAGSGPVPVEPREG